MRTGHLDLKVIMLHNGESAIPNTLTRGKFWLYKVFDTQYSTDDADECFMQVDKNTGKVTFMGKL